MGYGVALLNATDPIALMEPSNFLRSKF